MEYLLNNKTINNEYKNMNELKTTMLSERSQTLMTPQYITPTERGRAPVMESRSVVGRKWGGRLVTDCKNAQGNF